MFDAFHSLLLILGVADVSFNPIKYCADHQSFVVKGMVTVPIQVLICMRRLAVHKLFSWSHYLSNWIQEYDKLSLTVVEGGMKKFPGNYIVYFCGIYGVRRYLFTLGFLFHHLTKIGVSKI